MKEAGIAAAQVAAPGRSSRYARERSECMRVKGAEMDATKTCAAKVWTAVMTVCAACAFVLSVAIACPQGAHAATADDEQGTTLAATPAAASEAADDAGGADVAGETSDADGEDGDASASETQADADTPSGDAPADGTDDADADNDADDAADDAAGADKDADTSADKNASADKDAATDTKADETDADASTADTADKAASSTNSASTANSATAATTTTTTAKTAATATAKTTTTTATAASTPKGGTRVLQNGHTYIFYSDASGKNVEVYRGSTSNKAAITQYAANYTASQQWRVSYDADNYATFTNVKTGKVIDVANGKAFKGATVWQYAANGTLAQKWIVTKLASGGYRIVSALDSRFALDLYDASKSNDAKLWLYKVNGTAAQCWRFYDVTAAQATLAQQVATYKNAIASGIYTIATSLSGNRVLDVYDGSTSNGGNVQLWDSNSTQAQMWRITYDSTGYMQLENVKSGKVLDVANGKKTHGNNVWQYASNGSLAQKWVAVPYGDGTYKLVSALFPRIVLDVAGGSSAKGTNINIFKANSTPAQHWKFTKVTAIVANGLYSIASVKTSKKAVDLSNAGTADNTKIQLWTTNKTYAQKWYLTKVAANTYTVQSTSSGKYLTVKSDDSLYQHAKTGGTDQQWLIDRTGGYYILKSVLTGKALDLAGGNTADGTVIQTWRWKNSTAQRWQLASAYAVEPNAYFTIVSALSSKMIVGAAYARTSVGTNVSLTTKSTYDTQKWLFTLNSDKTYTIVNAGAGLALDVAGGSTASGTNVQLWSSNSTKAQKWRVYWSASGYFTIAPQLNTSLRLDVANAGTANETNIQVYTSNGTLAQGWRFSSTSYNANQSLRGIDIASWEAGIDIWSVDADFIIVKVSQGTSYTNPYWREWAEATLQSGKKLGLYHYAAGGNPEDEANYFVNQIGDYIGRAVLVIDWESEQNSSYSENGAWWTDRWRAQVKNRTGKTAWTYISQSISHYYSGPLWIAQYPNYDTMGYQDHPWNEGAYDCVCRQYTSQGDISGYSGLLDLNKFYGSRSDWDAWAQGRSS